MPEKEQIGNCHTINGVLNKLMLECWCALIGVHRVSACTMPVLSKTSCACTELRPGAIVLSGLTSRVSVPS